MHRRSSVPALRVKGLAAAVCISALAISGLPGMPAAAPTAGADGTGRASFTVA